MVMTGTVEDPVVPNEHRLCTQYAVSGRSTPGCCCGGCCCYRDAGRGMDRPKLYGRHFREAIFALPERTVSHLGTPPANGGLGV